MNTSTIRGQKLELPAQIDVAADAGYTAVELWVGDVQEFKRKGGSLRELASRLRDRGLAVPSTIAFFSWMCDDATRRAQGLEQAKREMDLVRQIGATRIAAPPAGASDRRVDLLDAAHRYRELLDIGSSLGVVPELELWGFSKSLSRVGEAACVAMESSHPQACLLLDVFHIYKGGSDFGSLRFLNGSAMHVLHMNDYPAAPPRAPNQRCRADFSRRRGRAVGPDSPHASRHRLSRLSVAGALQSSVLETGRAPHGAAPACRR